MVRIHISIWAMDVNDLCIGAPIWAMDVKGLILKL